MLSGKGVVYDAFLCSLIFQGLTLAYTVYEFDPNGKLGNFYLFASFNKCSTLGFIVAVWSKY